MTHRGEMLCINAWIIEMTKGRKRQGRTAIVIESWQIRSEMGFFGSAAVPNGEYVILVKSMTSLPILAWPLDFVPFPSST